MATPADPIASLLDQAGFKRRAGADPAAIARLENKLGFKLPAGVSDLWLHSDGMSGDGIEILSLAEMEKYAGAFEEGFYCLPFTDCNDSNPYVICCSDPLVGYVAHIFHDNEPELVACNLGRFLELVIAAQTSDDDRHSVDWIAGDYAFEKSARAADNAVTARALVRIASKMKPEYWWRSALQRFAAQLFGPGEEEELRDLLNQGDEYTREAVRERWKGIGTPNAKEQLKKDDTAYQVFLKELRQAMEAAGLRTEPERRGDGFRLQPGNVGLNFAMLFAKCRQPGKMAECVQTFVERQKARQ